ncbi:MAG: glycosyltransferase family 2 protein [Chitinophagia bacterium]|nr:glycosyltransferase family 2 protein [Chitinophagia bacterium]
MKPSVSIVILNFNGAKYLQEFLPSVLATNYENFEIVVADNGSSDDSILVLNQQFPSVKIITSATNEGFAGGYNWALKQICSNYYVLLNSDVSVDPNWLIPMVDLLESNLSIGACQPKILSQKQTNYFEYAGAAGGWIDSLGYPFSRGRVFDICEIDQHQYDDEAPIFWATGACMMIRASLFHTLKGFDASFFAHQEEIDLCWRMQLAGHQLYACPASKVFHVGAGTLPRGGRKVFLNFRNNLIMMAKNLSWGELFWKMPIRFALDAISAYKGLLTGDISFFMAIAKAHFAFFGYVIQGKLSRSPNTKPLNSLQGVYGGSVVWQYFVKNKQQFDKIVPKAALN